MNPAPRPLYHMLNVRYFLDVPSRVRSDMTAVEQPRFDLDVSRNEGEWPRAFFVANLGQYERVEQFVEILRGADSHPFAAVQKKGEPVSNAQPPAVPAPTLTGRDRLDDLNRMGRDDVPAAARDHQSERPLKG